MIDVDQAIAQMLGHSALSAPEDVWAMEAAVSECASVIEQLPATKVAQLISVFRDDVTHCEAHGSLMHLVEAVPSKTYVAALLIAVPLLGFRAAEWRVTLLSRILNSPPDFAALEEQFPNAPEATRLTIIDILRQLVADGYPRADHMLAALRVDRNE